jgi:anti-sigma factor RsiW
MNGSQDMNAPPSEAEIHAWVDGRLDDADRLRVEDWLATQPERADEIRAWQRDAQQLRAAFGGFPTQARQTALDPVAVRGWRRRRLRSRLALAAALVLTLGMGGIGGWQARSLSGPAAAAPMADALQAYRLFAADRETAMDVTQRHAGDLQHWLDQHFEHAPELPNLRDAGFHPVGGRLLATDNGPAAIVLYEDPDGSAISFYIRPPARGAGALPRGDRREGQLAAAYWSGSGYNYALVSRANGPDLRALRDAALPSSI